MSFGQGEFVSLDEFRSRRAAAGGPGSLPVKDAAPTAAVLDPSPGITLSLDLSGQPGETTRTTSSGYAGPVTATEAEE